MSSLLQSSLCTNNEAGEIPVVARVVFDNMSIKMHTSRWLRLHYRITINLVMDISIPCVEDICATLARGKCFLKFDLTNAYQ